MPVEKKYLHDINLVNNKLINPLLNPLTTIQRTSNSFLFTAADEGYATYDVDENLFYFWNGSSWQTIGGGSFGKGEWGSITGTLSAQTDLINFLSSTYTPLNRNITINGVTQNLSVDRSWTITGLPSQTGNAGKYLTTDGTNASWATVSGGGTLVALPFTTDHLTANNNQYVVGDVVWYLGNVYRCIANNDSILPTSTLYWTNLGAGYPLVQQPVDWSSTSGNNQILNKPTIPAAQVNSDWNAVSGLAEILNKPTIPTVGTWGALNYPTWVSGTPFVKMTAAGTFALDTNTYLTSAVTSVGATSPITSSGGNTPTISTSMATNKLIGRSTAGTGVMEEITVGTGLSLSGGTLNSTAAGILHGTALGTDTYTVTISGPTAYADGDAYLIRFTNGNTTGCTLNINSIGAIPLYRNNDGALIGGDIEDGAEMLCVYNSTLAIFQCIGTSPNTILAYVTNAEASSITKGQVVYAFGGTGDRMTVKLANNSGDATSAQTVGLVWSTSIGANQKGFIMLQGLLDGLSILPTATYTDGDAIYLGATAGSITNVKPYAPNHLVYLGVVTTASNGSSGRMYVKVQNGYELDELHNVQAQSPTVNDVLYYFGGSPGQWKTASLSSILGYTPVGPDDTDYEYLMMSSFRTTYNY